MCYYDRISFPCNCRYWGIRRRKCKQAEEVNCVLKRVHKHLYAPSGLYCKKHSQPPSESPFAWLERVTLDIIVRPSARNAAVFPEDHRDRCTELGCFLRVNHGPPHQSWKECNTPRCFLPEGHGGLHSDDLSPLSADLDKRYEESLKRVVVQLQNLNKSVLNGMGRPSLQDTTSSAPPNQLPESNSDNQVPPGDSRIENSGAKQKRKIAIQLARTRKDRDVETGFLSATDTQVTPYQPLNYEKREIRLYEALPSSDSTKIKGRFVVTSLADCPSYIALSYTWGAEEAYEPTISINSCSCVPVRKNLRDFLHLQCSVLKGPELFWIDAICIDQPNTTERNQQVAMMKEIYANAAVVYVWLGKEADESDLAMDWLIQKGNRQLRPHGPGYYSMWNRTEGRALVKLCERPYWRRMWVIQEILHAKAITIWCGSKSVEWTVIERLYLTLKTLEDEHWDTHHESALGVLQSSAAVMAWQRAHWRYPGLSAPRLQTLIEIFRDWQCKDVRDKVFALVSLASSETQVVPDYSLTARDIYHAVQQKHPHAGWKFQNLLSQILGLSGRDIKLVQGQDLIEYKIPPSQSFTLRRRFFDDQW